MTPKNLNIAVVIKEFSKTGGSEKYAVEVSSRLRDKGHLINLYTKQVKNNLAAGMHVTLVPNELTFSSVLSLYAFIQKVSSLVTQHKFDIVHSHERGLWPDILTQHCFTHLAGLKQYPCLRRIDQIYCSPRNALYLWLEKKQMQTPRLIAVSKAIAEDIKSQYHRTHHVSVITPGVDINWFSPEWISENREIIRQEENIGEQELVILFVGSEFKRKGLDQVLPAIGPNMRLIVVGRDDNLQQYKDSIARRNLGDKVKFTGLVQDVRRYFACADLVVLPSRSEAFGMSILEGMACGLPVVTTANCGVAELVKEGINGFAPSSPAAFKDIFQQLRDAATRKTIGAMARETALSCTWDAITDAHEKLYYEVLEDKLKAL